MDDARTRRLEERISKIVAELLERRIKDPRLGFVTVTEVRLTADWREAKVFYTVFGTPEEQAETAVALRSATGIIRSEVGRIIGLRHAPSIEFVTDALPDSARRIDDLVAAARQAGRGAGPGPRGRPVGRRPRPVQEAGRGRRRRRLETTTRPTSRTTRAKTANDRAERPGRGR